MAAGAAAENLNSDTTGKNQVFEDARDRFLETLSDEDRSRYSVCASSRDLIDGLYNLDIVARNGQKNRGARVLKAIKSFSDRLQPFFNVISTYIQADPSPSAFVWGSIRLVLQLASNYVTFFDKLIQHIERLTEAFPQYEDIARLCVNHGPRTAATTMKQHLEEVYIDLLQFFQAVARVFTNKKGKLKRTSLAIGVLFWNPFDLLFEEIMSRMVHHRGLLSLDIQLLQAEILEAIDAEGLKQNRLAAEEREKARLRTVYSMSDMQWVKDDLLKRRKENTLRRVYKWLAAPSFSETLQNAQAVRQQGTDSWIFGDQKFQDWIGGSQECQQAVAAKKKRQLSSNVFWIHGNPGSGKTVLASYIVEELQPHPQGDEAHLFYFFFRQAQLAENHRAAAYRSLLSQIIYKFQDCEDILDTFLFAYETMSEGQMIATTNVLIELLHLCAAKLPNIFILLDGIDECSDSEDLLADLSQLDALLTYKFLLLSRHNLPRLAKMILDHQQKEMERVLVSNDIAIYLEHQLQQLVEEDMLPEDRDISSLVAHMVKGADGMFLWATLMISYLKSPILTPSRRVRTIMEIVMPEGLESMYERIIGLIQRHRKPERDLASQILVWLIYAKQRFSVSQLRSIVMENEEESSIMHFTQTVTFVCGSLVESRRVGADDCIDFIHLSAREYFNQSNGGFPSPNNFLESLIPPKEVANLYLSKHCFAELIAGKGMRGGTIRSQFTSYATKYATAHLMDTRGFLFTPSFKSNGVWQKNALDMLKTCQEFFREPSAISSWIERIYRHGRLMSEGMNSPIPYDNIKQWAEWADLYMPAEKDRNLIADMKDFVIDMKAISFHWDTNLRSDPSLIWDEVSAFTQSRFLQPSTSTNVSSLKPKQPENASTSSRSLCTISSVSSDCNKTGILTIWPSTAFEESWQKLEPGEPLTSMLHLCSGWRATYELWIQDERKHSIQIDLEESEVSILMRQSFREELTNEWKTSFPLVISPSLTSFIILRTLFTLNPSTYTKSKIDLSFLDSTYSYWNPDLQPFEPQIEDLPNLPPFLRHLHHDWYSYKFTFSPSEDYILFSDFVYHQESTNLSILRRSPSGKVQHISSLKIKMPFRHEHKLLSIFHPEEDLLFFFASGQVQAWRFLNSDIFQVAQPYAWKGDHLSNLEDQPRDILLSSCGRYILLSRNKPSTTNSPRSQTSSQNDVIPIPYHLFSSSPAQTPALTEASASSSSTSLSRIGCTDISSFNIKPGQVLGNRQFHLSTNGSTMQVLSGSSLRIDLDKRNQDTPELSQSLNVIAVPEMKFSDKFESVIQLPTDESTRVRIHMNRKMQTGYDLRDESNDPAPVISSRDVRFMKLQTTGVGLLKCEDKKNPFSFGENRSQIASMRLSGSNALDSDETVGKRAFEDIDQTMTKRLKW